MGVWLAAEAAHALADRGSSAPVRSGTDETLLVLGCPSRPDGRPSFRQRWRVSLAARNARPMTRLVFSGAHEAGVMASLAMSGYGIDPARVSCENQATNTWENIGCSAAMIAPGGVVRMISDPLHARRGERYWRLRLPERADELHPARLYRFGERPLLKVATAVYEVLVRAVQYRPES